DPERAFELLSKDGESLISAAEENIFRRHSIPNLYIRTEYDNIYASDIPKIRKWLLKEGALFHKRAREFMNRFDRDINPRLEKIVKASASISLTSFSLSID